MSKTHLVYQTPAAEYIINSMAESGLSEDRFYEIRVGQTVEYPDGIYTCLFCGTYDHCVAQIQRLRTYTPLKASSQNHVFSPSINQRTPLFTTPRMPTSTSFSNSRNKRPISSIEEEDEEEEFRPSNFKLSKKMEIDEDEYQTLKITVGDLTEQVGNLRDGFGRLQNELEATKAENAELRAVVDKIRSPGKPRGNRPTEDELSKMTVIDEDDQEVLLSSLSERKLLLLLQRKRQLLGNPPTHPGLNHQDVIDKIGDEMIFELSKKSTMGFAFRLATYFIDREAFLSTYFKQLVPHNGNNHPFRESKRTVSDAAHKLIKYYAKFFAACLFDHSPHNCNRWIFSVSHSLNRKVDYLNGKIREGKTAIYYTYDDHHPLFTTANCFIQQNEAEE